MISGHVRVMMLGWEYPPRFAGGLGKACQGLATAMGRAGAQVYFVLPTFPERKVETRLEVIGALECALAAGWTRPANPSRPGMQVLATPARLFPYGEAPNGPMPESLAGVFSAEGEGIPSESSKTPFASAPQQPSPSGGQAGEIYGRNLWSEIEHFCLTVRHLAETHEVDVVHAHDWMTFPAAFAFKRVTGVPVFLHVHATEYDRSGENLNNEIFRIEREGFREATHIFSVSRYTAGIIERLYGINRRKITVIHNAPEDGEREPMPGAATEGQERRKRQVVFLGRLTFQKGPDHFLKAAQLVSRADPDARFVFCGTGDMMDKLRAQAHKLGIEEQVHFAGFVDPVGVDRILFESRVLVMPSVSEPFGLVALEAIRCGIPVILSKQSGVREVLPRALQADFWDHERLADQILAALRLPELSRQLVEDSATSMRGLSWEKSAARVLESYRQHLGTTYAQTIADIRGGAHGH